MPEDLTKNESFLLAQVARGDNGAFSHLYKKYSNELYAFLFSLTQSREDAEDGVHDIFLSVYTQRQSLTGIRDFKAYLFRSAKNYFINLIRKNSKTKLTGDIDDFPESGQNFTEETFDGRNFNEFLENAKKDLPEQQRIAFSLSRDGGLGIAQIANEMDLSQSTVKEHVSKALKTLRKKYHHYINPGLILFFGLLFRL
ncbi:MAG: RNA polymerase sigma factor [Chitinophagaceae bacterium]